MLSTRCYLKAVGLMGMCSLCLLEAASLVEGLQSSAAMPGTQRLAQTVTAQDLSSQGCRTATARVLFQQKEPTSESASNRSCPHAPSPHADACTHAWGRLGAGC